MVTSTTHHESNVAKVYNMGQMAKESLWRIGNTNVAKTQKGEMGQLPKEMNVLCVERLGHFKRDCPKLKEQGWRKWEWLRLGLCSSGMQKRREKCTGNPNAKSSRVFLAQISAKKEEDKSEGKQIKDVPIVRDFPEVFPEDLPGLPPARPVEF
ncbi:hypothetical protein Tco_0991108 [Tanacetum coccineum]|uniref:Reverse transcriptase domain-containing protein n=1 Tax=Tanacetum coccineum TaxID=301880 RepID=A0ABQ5EYQ1_9ASTR